MNGQRFSPVLGRDKGGESCNPGREIKACGQSKKEQTPPKAQEAVGNGNPDQGESPCKSGKDDRVSMCRDRGEKPGSHDRQKISGRGYQEQSPCLCVGDGEVGFNGRQQGSDDDPAQEVEKKDGGKEKDRSYLRTKG
jgi:hypothetical protein